MQGWAYTIERAGKSGDTVYWEYDECGKEWIREWGDRPENGNEDVEYCYVGAHTNSPKPEINHPEDNQ